MDINVSKVVDLHRYALNKKKVYHKILYILYTIYKIVFKKYEITFSNNSLQKVDFLFFKQLHRGDYDKLFNSIVSQCNYSKNIALAKECSTFNVFAFLQIIQGFNYYKKLDDTNIMTKIYLYLSFIYYFKHLKSFENIEFEYLVVFADMQPIDNLLVQYFNLKNKTTITLQHGLFVDYEGTYNISSVQYENVVSDYFITWGLENQKLIEKYNSECKVIVCGNPTIEYYKKPEKIDKEFFSVMFDWDVFKEQNQQMLNIAYEVADRLNIKFHLRMHPSNKKENYNIKSQYLIDNVDYRESIFILGHTSSMIHISLRLGLKIFKYDTDIPTSKIDTKYLFKNTDDVIEKYNNLDQYNDVSKDHITYIEKESLLEYEKLFNNLVNNRG